MPSTNVLPGTEPPVVLSDQLAQVAGSDTPADILIAGLPFLLAPDGDNPYIRESTEDQRDQFDSSREAGENSLGAWWLRSQATFHGGQGQEFLESQGESEVTRTRYNSSSKASIHEPGVLTLAGDLTSSAAARSGAEQVTWSGAQKLVSMQTGSNKVTVYNLPSLGSPTDITLGASGVPAAMTSDGVNVHVAIADKIWRIDSAGAAVNTHTLSFTGPVVMGFAKQRLIVCVGNKIYELDPNPASPPVVVGAAHYTNPSTAFVYTSVSEGPNGIYVSGYAGPHSNLASMSVTESGGTVVLGPPVVQLRVPPGEIIRDCFFYVSSFFALATSNGVRVGTFTPYGQPQVGRLLMDGTSCYSLTGSGTLIWVGAADSVWTVDLSTPTDQNGGYSHALHASGLGSSGTDGVNDITIFVGTNDLVFGTTVAGRLISQPTFTQTGTATLTTSWARFDTTEPKRLFYITVEGDEPNADVTVEAVTGETITFLLDGSASTFEFSTASLPPAQSFRVKFTLRSGSIRSYQLKALATPRRYKEIILPLLLFNSEAPFGSEIVGYDGYAKDRLLALESLAENNVRVTVKDEIMRASYEAMIRRLQFRQTVRPTPAGGLGGVVNVILRLV